MGLFQPFRFHTSFHLRITGNLELAQLGPVSLIGINRPEKRNAVDPTTAKELIQAFQKFEEDDQSKVAVLYGKGGYFSAGLDLKSLAGSEANIKTPSPKEGLVAPMGPSRMMLSKPVIGAISGYAVAGGLELALLCDLRVVEENAIMGVFCRRFGVPLVDGGTVRLPQLIGLSRAMDLILTGRPIGAKEALEFGLANRIAPHGQGLNHAIELANEISKFPQRCMNTDRRSAYNSTFNAKNMTEALQFEFENGMEVVKEEAIPGAQSFKDGVGRHGSFSKFKD
ncbi:hypothetical protein LOTGIDRAFT_129882 [Lottia gigantea]|uniref:Enoyl-CoA hydratase n=1 Tax=Lottia gigantea TaxID=225164 RepID=V3ZYN5_LOTGI|nr:hypothetical protein LOTGIDRAFT_129882 [Lottia gigantea]ESO86101.1 hypothetical protein LOTGIDRAFT_129882 [Lottia gigantea]